VAKPPVYFSAKQIMDKNLKESRVQSGSDSQNGDLVIHDDSQLSSSSPRAGGDFRRKIGQDLKLKFYWNKDFKMRP